VKYRADGSRPQGEEKPVRAWYGGVESRARRAASLRPPAAIIGQCVRCRRAVAIGADLEGTCGMSTRQSSMRISCWADEIEGKACRVLLRVRRGGGGGGGDSHTSSTGRCTSAKVRLFPGGSSSAARAWSACGDVDMASGGDQDGSIRIPESHSAAVGSSRRLG